MDKLREWIAGTLIEVSFWCLQWASDIAPNLLKVEVSRESAEDSDLSLWDEGDSESPNRKGR